MPVCDVAVIKTAGMHPDNHPAAVKSGVYCPVFCIFIYKKISTDVCK